MPESRSLSELTRQIAPPTKNGHAPPPTESRKSYQSVNPFRVRAGFSFATILPPEPKDFGFPDAARRLRYSGDRACFEHSNFFKVNASDPAGHSAKSIEGAPRGRGWDRRASKESCIVIFRHYLPESGAQKVPSKVDRADIRMRRRRHEGQRSARGYLESPKRPGHPEGQPRMGFGSDKCTHPRRSALVGMY
ncbi:hypothetical protein Q8A73_024521 [Channa argus]|nr:hypothetical protein Q8A73_024514 [Channa argus]KAK2873298.1 hypothetical protein Q8A73_024521 [Channa argus]